MKHLLMTKQPQVPVDLAKELQEQTALGDAGEAGAVLLHELGNALNDVLLDTKMLQPELADAHSERLSESVRRITQAAGQMIRVSQYRQRCRCPAYPVDLNALIEQVVSELPAKRDAVQTDLEDGLPGVSASLAEMKRLLRLLIANALAVSSGKKPTVMIRTRREGQSAFLSIAARSSTFTSEQLPLLFEPFQTIDDQWNNLELAVCKNLARRMNGQIGVSNQKNGDLEVMVSWKVGGE